MLNVLFTIRVNVVKETFILDVYNTQRFWQTKFCTINNLPSISATTDISSGLCRDSYQSLDTYLK